MNTVKVISAEFDNLKRRVVKFFRLGKSDVQTAVESGPFGVDSHPMKDMVAIYAKTGMKDKSVIIGYINRNQLAAIGETRLFSLDGEGELATYLWLKNDGTMELGGDTDFMLRFSKTKEVVDELQSDIATLKQAFSTWVVVPTDGGTALKTITATWAGTELSKNIDAAKIEEIKTS